MEQRKSMINDLLSVQMDSSEIYNSQLFKELEEHIMKYEDKFADKLDDRLFSEYREARIDSERLFYYFGFIEGIRFIKFLSETPPNNLIDGMFLKDRLDSQ